MPAHSRPPLISVITPCLNAVEYIAVSIESVLEQEYENFEHIVVDGGSCCMSSEHFGQLAWQFKRMSGSSGLKVQAAIAC